MTVILTRVQVRIRKRNEFLKIMSEIEKRLKKEGGCEQFEIYQHMENDFTFSFYGIWKTPTDLRKHLRSDEFSMILIALKLLRKNPEIRCFQKQIEIGLPGLLELRKSIENQNIN